MSKSMLTKMEQILQKIQEMSSDQFEAFISEGSARAAHVLSKEYQEDRDFKIVGEEFLYNEVMTCEYPMDKEPEVSLTIDQSQNQMLCIAMAA